MKTHPSVSQLFLLVWFCINLPRAGAQPANDNFSDRLDIAAQSIRIFLNLSNATSELNEQLPTAQSSNTLWWKFEAPGAGVISLLASPEVAGVEARASLFAGSDLPSLQRITIAPGGSFHYAVQGGVEYAIQIAAPPATAGQTILDLKFYSNTNDSFSGSEQITGLDITYEGNFTTATLEEDEWISGPTNTVWVSWEAPASGRVFYWLDNTYQFQVALAFTGPSLGHLVAIPGLNEKRGTFLGTQGLVYHFRMAGGADDFRLHIQQTPLTPATNDDFADAMPLLRFNPPQSVMEATMEPGEPQHFGPTPQKSIWWNWRAPDHGRLSVQSQDAIIPEVVFGLYSGDTVEALTLVKKGTNFILADVMSSEVYYLAAAVPENAIGDVASFTQLNPYPVTPTFPVPSNLLLEPSWENTGITQTRFWHYSGDLSGEVNKRGGMDGMTWPILRPGVSIWQDIATVPGHEYRIRFAHRPTGNWDIPTQTRVKWGEQDLGIASLPADTAYWTWAEYVVRASNTTTRLAFENTLRNVAMDAFSVVDFTSPPVITAQPASATVIAGGTVGFTVTAYGAPPLVFQWYHDDSPLPGATNRTLIIEKVTLAQAGQYRVSISNGNGTTESQNALLKIESTETATIVVQPYGDFVALTGYAVLSVVATGTAPLEYQWYQNGLAIPDATNRSMVFTNFQTSNAGTYEVFVQNFGGGVWSLPASLIATNMPGGGSINFRNGAFPFFDPLIHAPIYDVDGVTPLNGSRYVAQLYAGSTIENLRPAGEPTPFRTGSGAGFFLPRITILPSVPPGFQAFAQVRVWEISFGVSYEEARALGGKFGRSGIVEVTASGGTSLPNSLIGLTSFSLQAGLPAFTVGSLRFIGNAPGGLANWLLQGEPGFRYVVETASAPEKSLWRPFLLLTNTTGTVIFTVPRSSDSMFYRSRILD